jgi:predicted RNA-binding Zn ribbon-like protein
MTIERVVKRDARESGQVAFRFVSGDRALNFVATFGDRHRDGVERLREPADLDRWLIAAGLPLSTQATSRDLRDARRLRETINRLARVSLCRHRADATDVAELNAWAQRPQLVPQLDVEFRSSWASRRSVTAVLALIAREAVELLTGPERDLIRECAAAPACSLLYLDRSRGTRRRWCEMDRCGSRAKMADYRQRQQPRAARPHAET